MRKVLLPAMLALMMTAGWAGAQDASPQTDKAHTPEPLTRIDGVSGNEKSPYRIDVYPGSDIDDAYPRDALLAQEAGLTRLSCDWDDSGAVTHCQLLDEAPSGAGFGAAALALVEKDGHVYAADPKAAFKAGMGIKVAIVWKAGPAPCAVADAMMKSDVVECASFVGTRSLADTYPERAMADDVEGTATVDCTVADEAGHLACAVVSEKPEGYGFGTMTVKALGRYLRVRAKQPGSAITGTVGRIVMGYRLGH